MIVVGDVTVPEVTSDTTDLNNLSKEVLIVGEGQSYKTVQSAVNSASAGDLIYITKGDQYE